MVKIICPYCYIAFRYEPKYTKNIIDLDLYDCTGLPLDGHKIECLYCPECGKLIIKLFHGVIDHFEDDNGNYDSGMKKVTKEEIIYPQNKRNSLLSDEIPEKYKNDYYEALKILTASPKASAAISRRLLQDILRNECSIPKNDLYNEIEAFITEPNTPKYLINSLHAVRNIGNFAAHPNKSTHTGEIIEVESGEAEWSIEVLNSLFDFIFVQPNILKEKRSDLNKKLEEAGKPTLKDFVE